MDVMKGEVVRVLQLADSSIVPVISTLLYYISQVIWVSKYSTGW